MYSRLKNIIPHKIKIDNFTARLLEKNDINLIQKFFESNEDYFLNVIGKKVANNEAEIFLSELPNGKSIEDKFLIGLFDGDKLISFVNLIQNFKTENQWLVNWL